MAKPRPTLETTKQRAFSALRFPLAVTRAGMVAERLIRVFWPSLTIAMLLAAAIMMDFVQADIPREWIVGIGGALLLGLVGTFCWGLWRLRLPVGAEVLDRLDRSLPGRPITAIGDVQAIGDTDPAARAVWRAHVERMAERVAAATPVPPDLRVSSKDRFGLRLMATSVFVLALIFGSFWRLGSVSEALGPDPAAALAGGPTWEGWVEPPAYTGLPSLYLADLGEASLELPQGTDVTIRLYGEVGALTVTQSVGDEIGVDPTNPTQEFEIIRDGQIEIAGPGGQAWNIRLLTDTVPTIQPEGPMEWGADGEMRQSFTATDDYGVVAAQALIRLDMDAVERRYGLTLEPEARDPVRLDLPMPISGDRSDFTEVLSENLSKHPWARMPVIVELSATDAQAQEGVSDPISTQLPGRRFFDPLAKAVIEARRDLLWTAENGARTAQVMRAVTHRADGFVRDASVYLQLRTAIRRLEADVRADDFTLEKRDELADVLWDIALLIEFGSLSDARERLERAQDRLSEAIENGASDEEIAALIEELRRAMQEYIQQLAEQQQNDPNQNQQAQNQQNQQQMTPQDLQSLLEQLQELMEQGRMAEAEQLLNQLRQMMENMQVTQGQQGQGQQSPGQQAMEDLAETLREQQGLSDEAFRDLQEQFNPGANQGQSQGNTGRDGGMGRGQQHQGGQGQGQQGNQQGQSGQGQQGGQGGDQDLGQSLADRQQALRQELQRQQGNMPGAGTPEGDAAREALGRAGEAMDRAEGDLRSDDLAGAIDNQAEAIDALREGMQALGEAMAQQQQEGQGQQRGEANQRSERDPLGRAEGNTGQLGTDENLLQGEDVYRRARELLDEIRRRQGDRSRPEQELDYLERLLDRF